MGIVDEATGLGGRDGTTPRPRFAEALAVWAKIGLLSFGGPAGQIALMHREIVETRGWVSEARFLNALNFCMLLPGPEAQQLATFLGWALHGTRGGIAAGTLFVLPGFIVISVLSTLYALFHQTQWLGDVFFGLKAAVVAIVVEALIKLGRRALKRRLSAVVAVAAFLAMFAFGVPFPLIVVVAGLAGFLASRRQVDAQEPPTTAPDEVQRHRPWRIASTWIAVWLAPVAFAAVLFGADSTLATLGVFFVKTALTTFGGAYAVLGYVAQVAVEPLHWLRPEEMLDGLALAETTPGPLLLVLSFVGYQAGFHAGAGLNGIAGGVLGAAMVAWVTFVPSFLWIFLGAPYIDRLNGRTGLDGALSAITAAVVGVILNLAVWFALNTLFTEIGRWHFGPIALALPRWASLDPAAATLTVLALACVFRWRLSMLTTLVVIGALGFAARSFA
ncbi:MAG: chromate efflux transporter [Ancalomicrobiaceae bacterium]|nr:chromate efflux transporter [Ancalomicrobiaceae bacterium]